MSARFDQQALNFICPYCQAEIGEWCITKSKRRYHYIHSSRTWPLREAWLDGYRQGIHDEKTAVSDRDRVEL